MDYCNFCRYGNNNHAANCPRDLPGAKARYDAGYLEGRRGLAHSSSDDAAHKAGFLRGEVAYEEWYNGSAW